ncbi:MAG: hypothetical protein ACLFUV_05645 [Methanomassiliicoccales archaeon]
MLLEVPMDAEMFGPLRINEVQEVIGYHSEEKPEPWICGVPREKLDPLLERTPSPFCDGRGIRFDKEVVREKEVIEPRTREIVTIGLDL